MKQKNWNILKEKYDSQNHFKLTLSKFLKRRRLDLNITLEELSKGICSTSYLSKIENGQVDVDESYYLLLFDKLDLDFEEVKSTRIQSIYTDLLLLYLYEKNDILEKRVNDLINTKYYCHTEIEIMVMLYNVTNGSLKEAESMMSRLVEIQAALAADDVKMLVFVMTLFYIKTSQYQKAFENISTLEHFSKNDERYEIAALDIMLEIYFSMNKKSLYWSTFNLFINHTLSNGMYRRYLRHRLQSLFLTSLDDFKSGLSGLENIKEEMGYEEYFVEEYCYYASMIYYRAGKYDFVNKLLEGGIQDPRIHVIKALMVINDPNYQRHYEFAKNCKNFETDNLSYQCVVEYARQRIEQYSYIKLFSYLKNVVFPLLRENINVFLGAAMLSEYVKISMELGKYKDTLKFVLNNNTLFL